MKRMMTNALAIAMAASWVMVAGAQSSTGSAQSEKRSNRNESKSMKFTGCLQQGDTPNSYKLTNVQPADTMSGTSGSGSTGSGTTGSGTTGSGTTGSGTTGSGTTGSGMGSMAVDELTLVPSGASVDLSLHVGKRVEITTKAMKSDKDTMSGTSGSGTTGSGTTGSGTTGSGTTGSGTTGGQSGMHSGHEKKVHVTAIRALGASCSGN